MRKLIELTHVTLGGEIGSPHEWVAPYLDAEHMEYSSNLLAEADVLLLGRVTYEGLSAAYTAMSPTAFVQRMNAIPKYVASRTLPEARWNATLIKGDVTSFVTDLKRENGGSILRYGNGALTPILMEATSSTNSTSCSRRSLSAKVNTSSGRSTAHLSWGSSTPSDLTVASCG